MDWLFEPRFSVLAMALGTLGLYFVANSLERAVERLLNWWRGA